MYAVDYEDLGTPPQTEGAPVTVEIDGQPVTVPDGTSVMRAAALAGVKVPKLCATDTLKAFGSCRLCLVEIEGRKGYPASCTTTVAAGMKIRTQSPKLMELRRTVVDLYVSDHPLECVGCPAEGHCELQDMAAVVGITETSYAAGVVHRPAKLDESNPYFTFNPELCIVCSRCVRACDETQGTLALTIQGRGFQSKVSASQDQPFMESECVSCGACVEACPTAALTEKSIIGLGVAERAVSTTCAYCGVGCGFKAELRGEGADVEVVRMVPDRDGKANHGHSCVKGRFAWGYATHADRITKPMIRKSIRDAWREVSWDEAIGYAASELRRIQAKYGRYSIGGITSSRCTNEETFLVQKLVRAAFGNNNVDTCARVCHSPTGYGLKNTLGESAGTQAFDSVMKADVVMIIGANPTEGHPVFASQLKRRLRQGAKLIIVDPREIGLVRTPHIEADVPSAAAARHQRRAAERARARRRHGRARQARTTSPSAASRTPSRSGRRSSPRSATHRRRPRRSPACPPSASVPPRACTPSGGNGAIYYGLGVTEHSQGTTTVMAIANLAMATGNLGREGVGVNPLRGQNNVQGSCDMGSFPHEFTGYRHVSDPVTRAAVRGRVGRHPAAGAGPAHPEHVRGRARRHLPRHVRAGRGLRAVRSEHAPRERRHGGDGVRHRAGPVPQRDRQVRARVPAGLVVPREGRHLHQRRAAHLAGAQGDGAAGPATRTGR